jgi:UDP-N-acetylmuramate--alanine ligase
MSEFAKALSRADRVMLLDIYPARELPIEGVSSTVLLEQISCGYKGLYKKESVVKFLSDSEVVLTLGAGDISDLINPIKIHLLS